MRTHETEGLFPVAYDEGSVSATAAGLPNNDNLKACAAVQIYFTVTGEPILIRMDGTAPTATYGRPIFDGDERMFTQAEAERLQFIFGAGTTAAKWRAHYYKRG